jgi:hypothetical protein
MSWAPPSAGMCNDRPVKPRSLIAIVLCLTFLGTQLAGLHFHVPVVHDHQEAGVAHHHHESVGHTESHLATLASALAADHLSGDHHGESDVDSGVGLAGKVSTVSLVLAVGLWLILLWSGRLSFGVRLPIQWLRPPALRRWPILLLPPSQGPPRAI